MPDNPVLVDFPNPLSNVFLMMRFRKTKQHRDIGETISAILNEYSLNLLRADFRQYHDELWGNVQSYMNASHYGIAAFEQIDERDINPNVSLELGYMFGQHKQCLLLKEKRVPSLPSDLVGRLYREFDSYNIEQTVRDEVRQWLRDLGVAKRSGERLLVFVSQGGTCRCAMAKVITQKLLQQNRPDFNLRVESVAYGDPTLPTASDGARRAIKEMYGEDLLSTHRTQRLTGTIKGEADLILVMDHSIFGGMKGTKPEKMHVLKPFFDVEGDVMDPYDKVHGDRDERASARYAKCAAELREILENNIGKIIQVLQPS
jgi:protein-tyrosine-phosphatase